MITYSTDRPGSARESEHFADLLRKREPDLDLAGYTGLRHPEFVRRLADPSVKLGHDIIAFIEGDS
jgi:hypothetical protein